MGKFSDALRDEVSGHSDTEWTGTLGKMDDVKLVSGPLTPNDITRISRVHPNFAQSPNMEGMVDLLILKCRDDDDQKAFDKGDKPLLMRMGTNKVAEIFQALFASQLVDDDDEAFEDRVKN